MQIRQKEIQRTEICLTLFLRNNDWKRHLANQKTFESAQVILWLDINT